MKTIEELRSEFEETEVFICFNEAFDIYYTNLGGYHFKKDGKCCFYLNGSWRLFQEINK